MKKMEEAVTKTLDAFSLKDFEEEFFYVKNKCKAKNIKYRCKIASEGNEYFYIGTTVSIFKRSLENHSSSFKDKNKRFQISLSKLIWSIKDKKQRLCY